MHMAFIVICVLINSYSLSFSLYMCASSINLSMRMHAMSNDDIIVNSESKTNQQYQ